MNEINTGGPAFPTENAHQSDVHKWHYEGMTLRDYFAAKALNGLVTNDKTAGLAFEVIAEWSYIQADAMLKARGEK